MWDKVYHSLGPGMVVADVDSVCFSLGSGWVAADVERGCFHFGSGRVVAPSLENTSAQGFHARGLGDAPEAYHRHQQETCIRHCSHTEGTAHASLCTAAVCAKHTEYHKTGMRCPWRIHGSAPRRWRSAALPPGIGAPLDRRGPDVSTYSSFYYLLLLRLLLRLLDHP